MYKFSKFKFWLVVISSICLVWGLIINPIRNNWGSIWCVDERNLLLPHSLAFLFIMIIVGIAVCVFMFYIIVRPECNCEDCMFFDNYRCNIVVPIKRLFNSSEKDGVYIPTIKRLLFFTKVKQNNIKYNTNDSCTDCANCMIKNSCKKNPNNPDNLDPIDREVNEMVRKIFID